MPLTKIILGEPDRPFGFFNGPAEVWGASWREILGITDPRTGTPMFGYFSPDASEVAGENKDADGYFGVRYFNYMPPGFLVSPTNAFVWESTHAKAERFTNSSALRGQSGFHAAWPYCLKQWAGAHVDHRETMVKALVKGHGDIVMGTLGWRSSECTLVSLAVRTIPAVAPLLEKRYKVPVITYEQFPSAFTPGPGYRQLKPPASKRPAAIYA